MNKDWDSYWKEQDKWWNTWGKFWIGVAILMWLAAYMCMV